MRPAKQVLEDALKLDPEMRVEIAEELLASVDGADVDPAFARDLERRIREVESGAVKTVQWSDVKTRLESRLSRRVGYTDCRGLPRSTGLRFHC